MRLLKETAGLKNAGYANLSLLLPLIIIFLALCSTAIVIPMLSTSEMFILIFGLIFLIVSFINTDIALYLLIFSMLLSPEFIIGETSGAAMRRGVTLRLDDLLMLIISFTWLVKMSLNKELGLFRRSPLNKPIAYYMIICLSSTLLGFLFGRVELMTGFFFVLKYFEYMLIYFMVINFLKTKKQAEHYLWGMLITCAIVSFIAIGQISLGGRATAPFEGASGEPNTLGGYLVLMISVSLGLYLVSPSFRKRLVYAALIILFSIPFLYTQSRSSYLAIIPSIMTFVLFSQKRKWIMAAILLISVCLPFIMPKVAKERIAYTFTQGKNRRDTVEIGGVKLDTSSSDRINSWKVASKVWIDHPFLGFGVTGYRFVDAQYLRIILETGFLGLIFFFVLIASLYRRAYVIFKSSDNVFEEGLSMGLLAGIIGLLVHGLGANTFIIVRIMEPFWFITAIVFSFSGLKEDRLYEEKPGIKEITSAH